jgi:hypothetical protein
MLNVVVLSVVVPYADLKSNVGVKQTCRMSLRNSLSNCFNI